MMSKKKKENKLILQKCCLLLLGVMIFVPACSNQTKTTESTKQEVETTISLKAGNELKKTKDTKVEQTKATTANVEYIVPKKDGLGVYTTEKQTKAKEEIDKKLTQKTYTIKKPLVYYNPFGTNLRSANVYFTTKQPCRVQYTVSVNSKEIEDYTQELHAGTKSGYTREHAYQLIGLVPNKQNKIQLKLYNKEGKQIASTQFIIQVPKIDSSAEQKLDVRTVKKEELTNGLFTLAFGRDTGKLPNINIYDNGGVIRAELPLESYRSDRILFIGDYLYYSVSYSKLVKVNRLGQVVKIYDLGDYTMHHDFTYEKSQQALVVLVSKKSDNTIEDRVITVNVKTGKVKEIVNLRNIMPKEYKKATKPKKKTVLDWAHINTIQCVNGTDLILSLRELSSIVKLKNVYTKPKLQYILCDKDIWEKSAYEKYVYDKVGDFTPHAGQHTVTYIEGKRKDIYHLSMFNNNFAYSGTRPDIDWSGYTLAKIPLEKRKSYYYEYEVNEKEKTFSLVKSFEVPYSGYISSTQQVGNHYVVCSGSQRVFGEYDKNGNLLVEYQSSANRTIYRAFKYDFKGFWFAN